MIQHGDLNPLEICSGTIRLPANQFEFFAIVSRVPMGSSIARGLELLSWRARETSRFRI